jgi:hypothetical protein
VIFLTGKELLYVEDVLGHEEFLKSCACETYNQLQDPELKKFMKELETKHSNLFNKFLNLL